MRATYWIVNSVKFRKVQSVNTASLKCAHEPNGELIFYGTVTLTLKDRSKIYHRGRIGTHEFEDDYGFILKPIK